MPLTVTNYTGDGVRNDQIVASIELPDSGTSVNITGSVTPMGGTRVAITGSPLTMPAAPGAGSTYWIIQVNTTTGAATVKQSNVSMPTADAGNDSIFQQTLGTTSTDPALVATDITPDNY